MINTQLYWLTTTRDWKAPRDDKLRPFWSSTSGTEEAQVEQDGQFQADLLHGFLGKPIAEDPPHAGPAIDRPQLMAKSARTAGNGYFGLADPATFTVSRERHNHDEMRVGVHVVAGHDHGRAHALLLVPL